jgi:hypothetical protein
MILHGFRAGSPVVTDTDCCPSAAQPLAAPFAMTRLQTEPDHLLG